MESAASIKGVDKMDYRFKVVVQVKDSLSEEEKKQLSNKINFLKKVLKLNQINECEFVSQKLDNTDFSRVYGLFMQLEEMKEFFNKLEYYDYIDDEVEVAV